MARYTSVEKIFRIIEILTRRSIPIHELATEAGISPMTAYRIVGALRRAGLNIRRYRGDGISYTLGHHDLWKFLTRGQQEE